MHRTLCSILTLVLATTAVLPSLQAHEDGAGEVRLYLNRDKDGNLTLTHLAPSSRNATTWSVGGTYHTTQGLSVRVPLADPNPNWVIDESKGANGWITYSFKQARQGGLLSSVQGYHYGSFEWLLVEGERSSQMTEECSQFNETYEYQCDAYAYRADFPGHGDKPTPHTHGNGADSDRGLHSGDLEWVLAYTIPPCNGLTCSIGSGSMKWEFSVVLDGTTFLNYAILDEDHPAPVAAAASGEAAPANGTAPEPPADPPAGNETGNQTGNQTGSGSEPSSFRPKAYSAQGADGTAPGAGLGAILATVGVAGLLLRRRRA